MKWKKKKKEETTTKRFACMRSLRCVVCVRRRAIEYRLVLLIECAFEKQAKRIRLNQCAWLSGCERERRPANGMNFDECKWFEQTNWVAPINANWYLLSAFKRANQRVTIKRWSHVWPPRPAKGNTSATWSMHECEFRWADGLNWTLNHIQLLLSQSQQQQIDCVSLVVLHSRTTPGTSSTSCIWNMARGMRLRIHPYRIHSKRFIICFLFIISVSTEQWAITLFEREFLRDSQDS